MLFSIAFRESRFCKKTKQNLIETISSKWHSGTILCVELGFFCFPYECYFALLILCGISEMLDFSGVDFLLVFVVLFFFKLLFWASIVS